MRQRDIVWVRFPYADAQKSKFRPALIVSKDEYNQTNPDVLVCAITSNLSPSPYKLSIKQKDLESGVLPLASMARADKILPVEKSLIEKPIARLDLASYDDLIQRLHGLIGRPKTDP
jgi:mRNA interferase MazF